MVFTLRILSKNIGYISVNLYSFINMQDSYENKFIKDEMRISSVDLIKVMRMT